MDLPYWKTISQVLNQSQNLEYIADSAGLGLRISKQNLKGCMASFFQDRKANNFKRNVTLTIIIVLLILWVNLFFPRAV